MNQTRPTSGDTHVGTNDSLSSGQAARLLEVSQSYLARLARLGEIRFETTPHGYRTFSRSEVERIQRERAAAGTAT